jgi:propanol-preferring alcohol dehydrogenase
MEVRGMRAMILREPKPVEQAPLEWVDLPTPEPGPGEIRLAVQACGVCHTDLHTVEGDLDLPKLPIVPGHQIVGYVDARGEGATRHEIGDRLGVAWLYETCQDCGFCERGLENLCSNARFTGLHANGGYAEAMVVPEGFAYPIPASFSSAEGAPLLCAGIIGYRALKLTEIEEGQNLGLYGFGGSAHITIQVARRWGCRAYVFTRSESHRRLAAELGAVWTGDAEDDPGARMHGSINFTPAGRLVLEGLRVMERGGTLVCAGVTMSPIPELDYDSLLYWERTLRSVANFTRDDAHELLQLAGEIPIETTIERFPLREANDVLLALKKSEIDGTAVLVIGDE